MKERLALFSNNRYAFMRDDGEQIIITGRHPEDAWENLCISFDDDRHYIKRFCDRTVNAHVIKKGFQWLNEIKKQEFLRKSDRCKDTNVEYGPVFIGL
jgi:hypothetical protein